MKKINKYSEYLNESMDIIKFRVKDGYSSRTIIATSDAIDVGYFKIDIEDIDDESKNDTAYIHEVELEDEYKGKGLSKKIFGEMIIWCVKKFGYKKFELEVDKDNVPAVKLYKSIGFEVVSENSDEFKMEKVIP